MTTLRKQLINLIEQDNIPPENVENALVATNVYPSKKNWGEFLDKLSLCLGALALAVSALFFIAYNWSALGRFAKFGMMEGLIVCAIIIYWKSAKHAMLGKISLLIASLFLGALMALYGQTYQTGADPWQLFFNWSLLILPWVFIGRFSALWILWIVLINLAIVLYHQTFGGVFGILFNSSEALLWIVFAFNTGALFLGEFSSTFWAWLSDRWAIRLLAVASGVTITWLCIFAIVDDASPLAGLAWLIWCTVMYFIYRKIKPDLFMLAGGCLSGIVVIITLLSRHMFGVGVNAGASLILAIIVIGLGTGTAIWLKNINKELQS